MRKCPRSILQCVDLLVRENIATGRTTINVNAKNANGLTPLDVLHIQDSYDVKIREKLEYAGAIGAPQRSKKFETCLERENNLQSEEPSRNWFKYFKFQMQRDSPSETRNALLVVAALIATVCFQAGTNPPKGVLDKLPPPPSPPPPPPPNQDSDGRQRIGPVGGSALAALAAIFGSHATPFLFLFGNSLGLTASTCIIIYLTSGFPFQRELHIALYSTMFTYGFAISTAIEGVRAEQKAMAYVLVSIAFALPFAQRWLPRWAKKARKYWKKRHARESNTTLSIEI
ncbi:PREDICTED: uncharacterized protein LOC105954744 [Erythranthe guttata]|uniref:uncharacterized protein LOC105954744 n=1 Tax=Erythranthe guttata TaxID=4155 RepID=UPI00064DCE74|nr:PREDICTED: uncharacterized protein LOC105954744 [Erythranthe guttata]|eukprot:XP_012833880.1 PREDICTED: uncharacterized protein LOC105954744 [Erythranthe guttata]